MLHGSWDSEIWVEIGKDLNCGLNKLKCDWIVVLRLLKLCDSFNTISSNSHTHSCVYIEKVELANLCLPLFLSMGQYVECECDIVDVAHD